MIKTKRVSRSLRRLRALILFQRFSLTIIHQETQAPDETPRSAACAVHEMIVPIMSGGQDYGALSNKMVYICFLAALLFEFAMHSSPMHAAERSAASSLLTEPQTASGKVSPQASTRISAVHVDRTTGRLIRTSTPVAPVQRPSPKWQDPPAPIQDLVEKAARANGVDPVLVHSVIQVESGYNKHAISPKGAEGLMQLMPGTSRSLGVGNSFDPAENIEAGVRYLKYLQGLYQDDRLALAAYNAGPKAVDKYKGSVPPFAETENYVEQVGARYRAGYEKLKQSGTPGALAPAGSQAYNQDKVSRGHSDAGPGSGRDSEDVHPKLEQHIDEQGRLYLKTAIQ